MAKPRLALGLAQWVEVSLSLPLPSPTSCTRVGEEKVPAAQHRLWTGVSGTRVLRPGMGH